MYDSALIYFSHHCLVCCLCSVSFFQPPVFVQLINQTEYFSMLCLFKICPYLSHSCVWNFYVCWWLIPFFFFFFPPSRACFIFFLGPYFCSLSKTCSAYLNFSLLCFMFPVHSLYPGISGDHMDLMNSLSSQVLCESV